MSWRHGESTTARSRRFLSALSVLVLAGCGGGSAPTSAPAELTVAEAVESGVEGPVRVRGSLLADETGVRLCNGLAESYPPQCGRPSLRVEGELGDLPLEDAQGVLWSEREVVLAGDLQAGTLHLH